MACEDPEEDGAPPANPTIALSSKCGLRLAASASPGGSVFEMQALRPPAPLSQSLPSNQTRR